MVSSFHVGEGWDGPHNVAGTGYLVVLIDVTKFKAKNNKEIEKF